MGNSCMEIFQSRQPAQTSLGGCGVCRLGGGDEKFMELEIYSSLWYEFTLFHPPMDVLPIKFPRDELESDRIKWNQMESNGIKWNLMEFNEIKWNIQPTGLSQGAT